MVKNNPKETLTSSMLWIVGLCAVAVGVPLAITLSLLLSSAAIEWLIRAFALRGSILIFFGLGGLMLICALVVTRINSHQQKLNLVTIMVIFSAAFVVTAIVGGVDVTRMMTSPVTLIRLAGNRAVSALDRKKRDTGHLSIRSTVGEIAGGIAVSYLIDYAPFPWNMLIFLAYYKFVTVIIFIIIPTVATLWIVAKVWYARKALKEEMSDHEGIDDKSFLSDESSNAEAEDLLHRRMTDTATVVQEENRNPLVYHHNKSRFPHSRNERPIATHHVIGSYPSV